ncbi:helix-turn-helix domain-containing protein [Streptomyces sp. NPDC088116]|uniref:helix-turn-helix domain-containing protein n=1 Tax=Streptomyces sp. NPDC088116 TaxID=3365825 RepID=UPI00381E97B4
MTQWSDYSTGERIQFLRGRDVSQVQLAHMTGLSVATIQSAEQDRRLTLPTLMALSDALGADISVIQGQQAPRRKMAQDDRKMVRALSSAVHDTAAGILPETAEPVTLDELTAATARCWELYWKGRYVEAGAVCAPFLISAAAYLREQPADARTGGWAVLADAYRISAYVANLIGVRDLAYAAIGHAQVAADRSADEMRSALVASGRSWVYLRDARLSDALKLAERSATAIEPRFSSATPAELTAYGSHINFAAVVASRMGNKELAADYLSQSHATGARMTREHRAHGTLFGPVSATTQAVGINLSLGQTGKALKLIDSIHDEDTSALPKAAQNRFQMDKALALADARLWDRSLDTLEAALREVPDWARHQTLPSVIAEKVGNGSTARLRRVHKLIGMRPPIDGGFARATGKTAL